MNYIADIRRDRGGTSPLPILPERVDPVNLADEIAFRIEEDILEGVWRPGSRLTQKEICERFSVSRTPAREAIRKLQSRNLIAFIPNKGATVRAPSKKELQDAYEVRGELEGYACERAAAQATEATFAQLEFAQQRIDKLISRIGEEEYYGSRGEPGSNDSLCRANDDFHDVILQAADNDELQRLVGGLGQIFPKDYSWRTVQTPEEMRTLNLEEHDHIYSAIASGQGAAARQMMRKHILHAGTTLITYLDKHGFWQ